MIARLPKETDAQYIARLQKANEELAAQATARTTMKLKVSEKGALSVYGLGRFPVTLYKEQWLRLLNDGSDKIRAFIEQNASALKTKESAA